MKQKTMCILLIEDDPDDVQILKEMLYDSTLGVYSITCANCLENALSRLRDKNFDLILLDLQLPDSFGIDTVKSIINKAPYTPVIVLTGNDDLSTALEATREGAMNYIIKNKINQVTLESVINNSLRYDLREAIFRN